MVKGHRQGGRFPRLTAAVRIKELLEFAKLGWVDWFNQRRLFNAIG